MMKQVKISLLMFLLIILTGCQQVLDDIGEEMIQSQDIKQSEELLLQSDGEDIELLIVNQQIVKELQDYLLLSLSLHELNGNEWFTNLPLELSMKSENIGVIEKGDIMLFGNKTLVIFYETHETKYPYTRVGKIKDVSYLENIKNSTEILIKNK